MDVSLVLIHKLANKRFFCELLAISKAECRPPQTP